jgi:6-phosphogluconolactonase
MIRTLLTIILSGMSLAAQAQTSDTSHEQFLLIGTYTKSADEGINVYAFNSQTGALHFVSITKNVDNPSYLVIAPDHQHVYSVNEVNPPKGEGGVSAFQWDTTSGALTFINRQPSGGDDPCYITTDQDGKYVLVGNYGGGSLSVLPVRNDGGVDAPVQTIEHTGNGPNKSRQEKPHVHCTVFGPDHQLLFVSDLGIDQIAIYNYKEGDVQPLVPANPGYAAVEPGSGPRHLVFHPDAKFAYIVQELGGKITAFAYDTGKLTPFQVISTLPVNYKGTPSGADIHISQDGKFLYASNRGDLNNIIVYSIDKKTGRLTKKGETPAGGKTPRNFMIDPSGNFLLVANQESNNVVVFKRDKLTGLLKRTGQEINVPAPVCLKMIGTH